MEFLSRTPTLICSISNQMKYIIEPGNLLTYKTESKNKSGEEIFEINHKIDESLKPAVVHGKSW
jgi:hypothetical protein